MMFGRTHIFGAVLITALLLAACGGALVTSEPSPLPSGEDQAENPSVTVNDQGAEDGTVVIEDVHAGAAGWIVIHINQDGAPGPVIGYARVNAGENHAVRVEIDLANATNELFAMLHVDAGTLGEYEFPGDDVPVRVDDAVVNVPFSVELPVDASVSVQDQDASGGTIVIDEVVAANPGWIVVHAALAGAPGPVVGFTQVDRGRSANVEVDIDLDTATPQLFAMLHLDAGTLDEYEFPGDDVPVRIDDTLVNTPFNVDFAVEPAISVSDQATDNGKVTIAKVSAGDPGWIVIHSDANGAPGSVVGFTPVLAGNNLDVEVGIDLAAATTQLYAMLHLDAGTIGTYEFPGDDVPVRVDDAVVNVPFTLLEGEAVSEETMVMVLDSRFDDKEIEIAIGTTVVWVQEGSFPHTVTSDDGLFDSGTLRTGGSFEFIFTEAGVFPYHCEFHGGPGGSGMSGTVTVTS
jgi:plastocyanin